MADASDPRLKNLRMFKKGQSGNPLGRPRMSEDERKARLLNKVEFERVLNRYIRMSMLEIKARVEDPKTPSLEQIVAKVIYEAAKRGDERRLSFILDRLIGPVKVILQLDQVSEAELINETRRRGFTLISGGKTEAAQTNPDISERIAQLKGEK